MWARRTISDDALGVVLDYVRLSPILVKRVPAQEWHSLLVKELKTLTWLQTPIAHDLVVFRKICQVAMIFLDVLQGPDDINAGSSNVCQIGSIAENRFGRALLDLQPTP